MSFFSCYLDVPKMNCHPVHNGIQRRGYAGRVRKAYRAIIRQELARDASLYVGELSTPMRGRTGRMYSRKRLMAALWDIGYILEALVHRARAQDEAARSAHLALMDNYLLEQLVFIDETHLSCCDPGVGAAALAAASKCTNFP